MDLSAYSREISDSEATAPPGCPKSHVSLLAEFVANDYESLKQKSRAASWAR